MTSPLDEFYRYKFAVPLIDAQRIGTFLMSDEGMDDIDPPPHRMLRNGSGYAVNSYTPEPGWRMLWVSDLSWQRLVNSVEFRYIVKLANVRSTQAGVPDLEPGVLFLD